MRKFWFSLTVLGVVAAVVAFAVAPRSGIAETKPDDTRPADMPPAPFNPQLSALMSMLIQPRHAKLGIAGKLENWPLAGYMFQELKQGFAVAGRAVPRWKGLPVPDLIEAAVVPTFAVLDFAIKAGEPHQFAEAYGKLTQGCNNCHTTMDHPYVVIKAPTDASAWPNQEFKPEQR